MVCWNEKKQGRNYCWCQIVKNMEKLNFFEKTLTNEEQDDLTDALHKFIIRR